MLFTEMIFVRLAKLRIIWHPCMHLAYVVTDLFVVFEFGLNFGCGFFVKRCNFSSYCRPTLQNLSASPKIFYHIVTY